MTNPSQHPEPALTRDNPSAAAGVDKPRLTRRRFLRRLGGFLGVAAGAALYGHYLGGNELEVNRVTVHIPGWPAGAPPLRLGFLSDFHCDSDEAVARSRRAVEMLLAEGPEAVLLGGDYITWSAQDWIAPMTRALAPLANVRGGVYGVLGNHDWWSGMQDEIAGSLGSAGICIMRNEAAALAEHPMLYLAALDSATDNHQNPGLALRGIPEPAMKLVLVHEPDVADFLPAGFALQCSGHSHAGQVRAFGRPIITPQLGHQYPQGLQQAANHPVYTTRGVGMMRPQVRIDCPPEVTVLILRA